MPSFNEDQISQDRLNMKETEIDKEREKNGSEYPLDI